MAIGLAWILREPRVVVDRTPATDADAGDAAPAEGLPNAAERGNTGQPLITSGGTLRLAAAELPDREALVVDLDIEIPPRSLHPHPTRVITEGREPLELEATVDSADPTRVRVELPPAWLTPGVYLVEVKTTEKSHFPLRRYKIVIE